MRKLALITGGTSGIGLALSEKLIDQHDLLLVFKEDEQKAKSAVEMLSKIHPKGRVQAVAADLARRESVSKILEKAKSFGDAPIEILINGAGRVNPTLFLEMEEGAREEILNVHIHGMMRMTHAVLVDMYRRKSGRILNFSSITMRGEKRGQAVYGAAKAAVETFTKSLALEVQTRGIRVNALRPGIIKTPMTIKVLENWPNAKILPMEAVIEPAMRLLTENVTGQIVEVS